MYISILLFFNICSSVFNVVNTAGETKITQMSTAEKNDAKILKLIGHGLMWVVALYCLYETVQCSGQLQYIDKIVTLSAFCLMAGSIIHAYLMHFQTPMNALLYQEYADILDKTLSLGNIIFSVTLFVLPFTKYKNDMCKRTIGYLPKKLMYKIRRPIEALTVEDKQKISQHFSSVQKANEVLEKTTEDLQRVVDDPDTDLLVRDAADKLQDTVDQATEAQVQMIRSIIKKPDKVNVEKQKTKVQNELQNVKQAVQELQDVVAIQPSAAKKNILDGQVEKIETATNQIEKSINKLGSKQSIDKLDSKQQKLEKTLEDIEDAAIILSQTATTSPQNPNVDQIQQVAEIIQDAAETAQSSNDEMSIQSPLDLGEAVVKSLTEAKSAAKDLQNNIAAAQAVSEDLALSASNSLGRT